MRTPKLSVENVELDEDLFDQSLSKSKPLAKLNLDPLTLQGNYISSTENQSQSICNTEPNHKDAR